MVAEGPGIKPSHFALLFLTVDNTLLLSDVYNQAQKFQVPSVTRTLAIWSPLKLSIFLKSDISHVLTDKGWFLWLFPPHASLLSPCSD